MCQIRQSRERVCTGSSNLLSDMIFRDYNKTPQHPCLGFRYISDESTVSSRPAKPRFRAATMLRFSLLLTAVALTAASPSPLSRRWGEMVVKHAWTEGAPTKWIAAGPPPPGATIDLRIKLKSADPDALVSTLLEVSNPGHSRYALPNAFPASRFTEGIAQLRCSSHIRRSLQARCASSGHTLNRR